MIRAYYVWGMGYLCELRFSMVGAAGVGGRGLDKIAQYDLSVIFTNIADLNSHLTNSEVFNII